MLTKKSAFTAVITGLLLFCGACKKSSPADSVVGNWNVVSTYYNVTSTSPCQRISNYTETELATVTEVNSNTVNIYINGTTVQQTIVGNTLDENANNAGVGYYGNPTDTLEWTLNGNTLTGVIKYQTCGTFGIVATKAN